MTLPHLHFTSLTPRELCGDLVESYRLAAEQLGYPTSYVDRCYQAGVINILFFFWDVPWEQIAPYHPDCIVVNFEPMVPGTHAWRDNYRGVLRQCYLWEYSKSNFQRHRELGFRVADYVPLAWQDGAAPVLPLADVLPDAEQDIDVVFFGTMTQRRADVLDQLILRGLRVRLTNAGQAWSLEERDDYLRRAKLVLNLHNWDNSRVVELPRLSILFRHRKAVVCELYPDSEIEPDLREAVAGVPYDRLVDTVVDLLADAPRRAALEQKGLALFSRHRQQTHVGPALARFMAWRAQQPDRIAPIANAAARRRVSVCIALDDASTSLAETLNALVQQCDVEVELIGVTSSPLPPSGAGALLSGAGWTGLGRVIALPVPCDRPTAWNIALAQCTGDHIVFCEAGDVDLHARLQQQVALLEANPTVDIVGCRTRAESAGELHHQLLADLLGPHALPLSACLLRRDFLLHTGVRHDADFAEGSGLQFLCKAAVAGARFASIPEVLHQPGTRPAADADGDAARRIAAAAVRSRALLLGHLLPHCARSEVSVMAQLYSHLWPPEAAFAATLLQTVARACTAGTAPGLHAESETLTRALREECLRLLQVFGQAQLIDQPWIDTQFGIAAVAEFLTPASPQLPLRPSPDVIPA